MPDERPPRLESLSNDEHSNDHLGYRYTDLRATKPSGEVDSKAATAVDSESTTERDLRATAEANSTAERSQRFVDSEGRRLLVRPCTPVADRDGLHEMYADFDQADQAQGIPPLDPADRREWLDALFGGRNYVVEDQNGELVGHAVLLPDPAASTAELAVFVAPANRGAGIGCELLRALLADPPTDVDTIWLTVERDNRPAVELYRKLGFEVVTRRRYELVMERTPGKLP